MSILFALLILIIGIAIAFWIVEKVKANSPAAPALTWTIVYIIIGLVAILALYGILTTGAFTVPSLK